MRRWSIPVILTAFLLFGLGTLLSQQNQEDGKFQKALDSFLDEYWKFYPTAATMAGYHKYDDKLADLSPRSLEKRHDALDAFNQEFVAKINRGALSLEFQADHEMIVDVLEMELFRHESLDPWEYNPLFYNDMLANGIEALLKSKSVPLETRVKSATERIKQLPGFLKQAKENLKTPPQIHTETAITQFPGILDFYRNRIPALVEGASADAKSKLAAETTKALTELEAYGNFLRNELLPRSTGNFRLGDQAHVRFLRLTAQNSIFFDEIMARARADYNNIRREMFLVGIPFYRIMYPNMNLEQLTTQRGEEEVRNIVIKGVLDKIKVEHASRADFLNRVKTTTDNLGSFFRQRDLIPLPDGPPAIEAMPLDRSGITWTLLSAPGAYENAGDYTVFITPIPADWPNDKATSFLEEYNDFYLHFWTVRKVYPGQVVPLSLARRNSSLVRKLFPNQALLRGWPIYVEEMLVTSGYENYDLRLRLNQLKLQLKTVIDFLLELNIHQGGMTKDQAIDYMTRGGFQSSVEAERMWNRIILKPGDAAFAYIGLQEILDMEKDVRRAKGDRFNQKEFLQSLVSHGAISLRQLKTRIQ